MIVVLELRAGPPASQEQIRLVREGRFRFGRTARADYIFENDPLMSGQHFQIELTPGKAWLRDLGSTNGTYLNDERVAEVALQHHAIIRAGQTEFRVRIEAFSTERETPRSAVTPANSPSILATVAPVEHHTARLINNQIVEETPLPTEIQKTILPGQLPDGQPILSVLVKRTYDILPGGRCRRSFQDRKLIAGDRHYGDPMNTPVQFEADFVPFKLATDVVFDSVAYAPRGSRTERLVVQVQVGSWRKAVLVLGDRVCHHRAGKTPLFSDPMPFSKIEMRYDRAYGGVDILSDPELPCIYARNHLGRGFAVKNVKDAVDQLALPNLEDPYDVLTPDRLCCENFWEWEKQPIPAGLGWVSKYWRPRALLAGVMPGDRALEREMRAFYAQSVPAAQRADYADNPLPDMDFRFFNGASSGLCQEFLRGDENIETVHLTADGPFRFSLPGDRPEVALDLGPGPVATDVVLQTVMVRMEERQVDLVWRGCVPYDGPDSLPALRKLEALVR